jgi:hypothetical protein
MARASRQPRGEQTAPRNAETLAGELVSASLDLYRDLRDATAEAAFFQVYGNMLSLNVADQQKAIRRAAKFDPRSLPAVRQVLDTLEQGSAVEGFVRIALLMAKAGSGKRKLAQMERVRELIAPAHIFDGVTEDEFRRLMHEETIVVEFEPERAKRALPKLLRLAGDRRHAHELLDVMAAQPQVRDQQRVLAQELKALLPLSAAARAAPPRVPTTKRARVRRAREATR